MLVPIHLLSSLSSAECISPPVSFVFDNLNTGIKDMILIPAQVRGGVITPIAVVFNIPEAINRIEILVIVLKIQKEN